MQEESRFPKVLVVGINAWREDGTAHTLMDIFRCWDPHKLALVYTRSDLPYTEVCQKYFQISENQVLSSVCKPWMRVGKEVVNTPFKDSVDINAEHTRYSQAHKRSSTLLPLLREFVWKLGHWKSQALKSFVKDFNPDIIFVPIYPTVYMGWIQKFIIKLTGKPYVCYLADDNYSYDSCRGVLSYLHRWWLRKQVGPLASGSKEMFVIVDKEKEDTDKRFGTNSVILTKSIDFEGRSYKAHEPNHPLKFVYTGSLIIGRDTTLAMLADIINKINSEKEQICAELFIYSQTEPNDSVISRINKDASHFCGRIGREEVIKVQQEADVVVFAEALFGKEANAANLSFSTKITDYLSNGKCILAIGKGDIAPIDYFRKYGSALIASSKDDIEVRVRELVASPRITDKYGRIAFDCAMKNHEKNMMNERFINTMRKAVK